MNDELVKAWETSDKSKEAKVLTVELTSDCWARYRYGTNTAGSVLSPKRSVVREFLAKRFPGVEPVFSPSLFWED